MDYYNKYLKYKNKYLFLSGGNFGDATIPGDFTENFYKQNIKNNDTLIIKNGSDLDEIREPNFSTNFLNNIKHVQILIDDITSFDIDYLFDNIPNITKLTIPSYSTSALNYILTKEYETLNELIINSTNVVPNNLVIDPNSCINLNKITINDNIYGRFYLNELNKLEEIIYNEDNNNNIFLSNNPELKSIIIRNINFDKFIYLDNLPKLEKIDLPINFKGTIHLENMNNFTNLLFSNHLKNNKY